MKKAATILMVTIAVACLWLAYLAGKHRILERREIYVLKNPLPIHGGNTLPAGTTLYHDRNMPEGFTRYYVYINVFGSPLKRHREPPYNFKDPISADHRESPDERDKPDN